MKLINSICLCLAIFSYKASPETLETLRIAIYTEMSKTTIKHSVFNGPQIDVIRALAKKLHVTPKFISCPIRRCLELMKTGKVDMMTNIRKNKERESYMTYLSPAYLDQSFPINFFVHRNSNININKYNDLLALRIGSIRGNSFFEKFDYDTQLNKRTVTSNKQLIKMLLTGRLDVLVGREFVMFPDKRSLDYYPNIKKVDFSYDKSVSSYISISKYSAFHEKLSVMNQSLKDLVDSGKIKKILSSNKN